MIQRPGIEVSYCRLFSRWAPAFILGLVGWVIVFEAGRAFGVW